MGVHLLKTFFYLKVVNIFSFERFSKICFYFTGWVQINAYTIIILPYVRHGSLFTVRGIIKQNGSECGTSWNGCLGTI